MGPSQARAQAREAKPGGAKPGQPKPGQGEEAKPGEAKPGDTKPGGAKTEMALQHGQEAETPRSLLTKLSYWWDERPGYGRTFFPDLSQNLKNETSGQGPCKTPNQANQAHNPACQLVGEFQ